MTPLCGTGTINETEAQGTRYAGTDAHYTRLLVRNPHASLRYPAACQATRPWQRRQVHHIQIAGECCLSEIREQRFTTVITNVQLEGGESDAKPFCHLRSRSSERAYQ
jgi:hypothetical protein